MQLGTIAPDELPAWVPGRLTVRSPAEGWNAEGWNGVSVPGYSYGGSDVVVPRCATT